MHDDGAVYVGERVASVRDRIAAAAERVGRDPAGIRLVAVTKGAAVPDVLSALRAGVTHLGENRLQDAEVRMAEVERMSQATDPSPAWHFIGHLQRNKAARVLRKFAYVDSVDSLRLARELSRLHAGSGEPEPDMPILIEVNTSGEASKHGFDASDGALLADRAVEIAGMPGLLVRGLMTIGPLGAGADAVRSSFRRLADIAKELGAVLGAAGHTQRGLELSMGMSGDFELAVEEGSTEVRVGSLIFSPDGRI